MRENLEQIYSVLTAFLESRGVTVSDDVLFTKAVDIYLAESIELNKDRRTQEINNPDKKQASSKQISFLWQLGYKGDTKNLTSKEASILITEYKDKKYQNSITDGENTEW